MDKIISVGQSMFDELRKSNSYYVDKTEILREIVESNDEVSLFTRPRRFGKTLMMSMIENFFNITKDSREMFEGLNIMNHPEFCDKHMNQYPVVFVSFKDAYLHPCASIAVHYNLVGALSPTELKTCSHRLRFSSLEAYEHLRPKLYILLGYTHHPKFR